jgi:hypothetical protein
MIRTAETHGKRLQKKLEEGGIYTDSQSNAQENTETSSATGKMRQR